MILNVMCCCLASSPSFFLVGMSILLTNLSDGTSACNEAIAALAVERVFSAIDLSFVDYSSIEGLFPSAALQSACKALHVRASVYKESWATSMFRFITPAAIVRPVPTTPPPTVFASGRPSSSALALSRSTASYTARCFLKVKSKVALKAKRTSLQQKLAVDMQTALDKNHAVYTKFASTSPRFVELSEGNDMMAKVQLSGYRHHSRSAIVVAQRARAAGNFFADILNVGWNPGL